MGFIVGEAVEIANFFFAEMIRFKILNRLDNLIRLYSLKNEDGIDYKMAAKTYTFSKINENPAPIRVFYHAFSRA